MAAAPTPRAEIKRERKRRHPSKIRSDEDRDKIAIRVTDFYRNDRSARNFDESARLQRYAKYRQWSEGANLPWDDASDVAIPDIMTHSLSVQDPLYNAVVATRPAIALRPRDEHDRARARTIDQLLDAQFFTENKGEQLVSEMVDYFVNDGVVTNFIPWVRETRKMNDMKIFSGIGPDDMPREMLGQIVQTEWPPGEWNHFIEGDQDGWDWRVEPGEGNKNGTAKKVRFYTKDNGDLEMLFEHEITVFDGPKITPLAYEQVICPPGVANLQPPSPSNPGGAPHVAILETITVDEIVKLRKNGFYDLITDEQMSKIGEARETSDETRARDQKRTLQGQVTSENVKDNNQGRLTLLRCFDLFDIDGDGIAEDMVWWVILETGTLCKAKLLTEMYPFNPVRRPFTEAAFLPIPGFREGIGIPELLEGMHDLRKATLDMALDAGTLTTFPFGFYRPSSNLKPEPMKIFPGELMPLSDPQRDINFPNIGQNTNSAFSLNILASAGQMEEKLSLVGDIQQGRVPAGRSSALRTSGGIAQLMEAGAGRPERILRRFFIMLKDTYSFMHQLNRAFLPESKEFVIAGVTDPGEEPYSRILRDDLEGEFQFTFEANVGNASRGALQESLQQMLALYVNELSVNLGIVTPENVYQLYKDIGQALGPNTDRYLTPPSPASSQVRITASQALIAIINGNFPSGIPFEPAEEHLKTLVAFTEDPEKMALLESGQRQALNSYMESVSQLMQEQQRQQQLQQQANAAGQAGQKPQAPGPQAGPPAPPQQQFEENELADETLPGAGGGGQQ